MPRLPPILASLTRHRLIVTLMVLSTAFTCAIVINLASMIGHRLTLLYAPSGLDESSLVLIDSSRIDTTAGAPGAQADLLPYYQADAAALRGIAGVRAVAIVGGLPMDGGWGLDITSSADASPDQDVQASAFPGSPGEVRTLGLHLVQGRDFLPSEYVRLDNGKGMNTVTAAIISRALAERVFHTDDVVGRLFYSGSQPIRVVGMVDHLMDMSPQLGAPDNENAMLLPVEPDGDDVTFALRTRPADRARVLKQAVALLGRNDPQRIFDDATTFTRLRTEYFQRDSAMIGLLLAAGIALLAVATAGIAGLASFWVQQRRRSIGIRRALGVTRGDILRYFQTENFLIVTLGVVLGMLLAIGLNLLLMKHFPLTRLSLWYLPVGAVALWLLGQLAVLASALRASRVPPVVAIRSV